MYWIGMDNKARYVKTVEEISEGDYNNNVCTIIEENGIMCRCGIGFKQFIVQGVGRYNPSVQEVVSANSMKECIEFINRKYKNRIENGTLLWIKYYEVI